jgi:hypothetical protein
MGYQKRVLNSIKFRTRYFLFNKVGLPSTSFSSLLFEKSISWIDRYLSDKHGVSLSISIKPLAEGEQYRNKYFAIVLHGKVYDEDFLIKNIQHMRSMCPESLLILSTYIDGMTPRLERTCEVENVNISLLDEPAQLPPPYAANFARGVASAYNGLVMAQSLGATRVMKLRVDQEITRAQGLKFAEKLLNGEILSGIGTGRIVGTSYNSYKQPPLFLSDMLQIGNIEDLLRYWAPFEPRNFEDLTNSIFSNADGVLSHWKAVPEVWLAARYLHSLDLHVGAAVNTNRQFWSNYAAVIDATTLGQNWLKSINCLDSNYASIKWFEESFDNQYLEMHFTDWALLALDSRNDER